MRLRVAILTGALLLLASGPAQAATSRFAGAWKGSRKLVKVGGATPKIGIGFKWRESGEFSPRKGYTLFDYPFGGGKFKLRRHGSTLRGKRPARHCGAGGYSVSLKPTRSVKFEGVRYATAARGRVRFTNRHCDGEFRSSEYTVKLKRPAPKVRVASFLQDGEWKCGTGYVVSFEAQDDDLPLDAREHGVKHSWRFGDGTTSGAASKKESATHTYPTPGNYSVALTEPLWDGSVARKTEQLSVPPPDC
jgi:PKD domain